MTPPPQPKHFFSGHQVVTPAIKKIKATFCKWEMRVCYNERSCPSTLSHARPHAQTVGKMALYTDLREKAYTSSGKSTLETCKLSSAHGEWIRGDVI